MSRLTLTAPNHEKPQNKKGSYFRNYLIQRAENGTQTRDPQLGRLVLYRLSYFRVMQVFPFRRLYVFSLSESIQRISHGRTGLYGPSIRKGEPCKF